MNLETAVGIPQSCHYGCVAPMLPGREFRLLSRNGSYRRKSDGKVCVRFLCSVCCRSFSNATRSQWYRLKRRNLMPEVYKGLASCVSLNRLALNLNANRKTIVRYSLLLGARAKARMLARQKELSSSSRALIDEVAFDEMESWVHSKCLPVSIPLIVAKKSREILGFGVAVMPAKGPLAEISQRKYGKRPDQREEVALQIFKQAKNILAPNVQLRSDENPKYPGWLRKGLPDANHTAYKGKRGCVVGQGELKRGGFDPLFALNHTAAMIRAGVNRLVRRTWCSTKRIDRLENHLAIYADFHNRVLI